MWLDLGTPTSQEIRCEENVFVSSSCGIGTQCESDQKAVGIDGEGGQYLFQILINCKSQLTTMELRGNELGNTGFLEVANGAFIWSYKLW